MSSGRQANTLSKARAMSSYEVDQAERRAIEVGVVKFYDAAKKFGFAQPEDPSKASVFLAGSLVTRAGIEALYPGDRLEYRRIPDRYGRADCASRIRLLKEEVVT